jgi:transposase-like protein
MSKKRRNYSPEEKLKIVLEVLKGDLTLSQITSKYEVHSTQIHTWKQQFKSRAADIFRDRRAKSEREREELIEELYKQIGQQKVELDWLKKKSALFR